MANVDGDPNVLVRLNNTSSAAGSTFIVRDQTSSNNKLKVQADDGLVTVYGDIERSAPLAFDNVDGGGGSVLAVMRRSGTSRMAFVASSGSSYAQVKAETSGWALRLTGDPVQLDTPNTTGVVARFLTNGTSRLFVEWDGTGSAAKIATANGLRLEADDDMVLHFGKSTGTAKEFHIRTTTSIGNERNLVTVSETGVFQWKDDAGDLEASLTPDDANNDCFLELGIDDQTRGVVRLDRDQSQGATRPGTVVLQDQDGNNHYLWVYDTNAGGTPYELRAVTNADPGTGSPAGFTVVHAWA